MSSTEIRSIVSGDLESLVGLFMACFNAPPWNDGWSTVAARERLADMLASPHSRGVVALAGSEALGMALGQKERWVEGYHFNLLEMCVTPAKQRQGLGGALLAQLLGELRREQVEKVYLITAPSGAAAAFYVKFGFQVSRGRSVMVSRGLGP